ncbi:hypothetical protein TNCV_4735491 [Trichonephila clavipes]|nr:hypothetical protein TNCV_4735491 [Trichonephila clavipes]
MLKLLRCRSTSIISVILSPHSTTGLPMRSASLTSKLPERNRRNQDPPCRGGRYTLNPSWLKCPPIGMLCKLGEGCQVKIRPRHLTMVQNYEVHRRLLLSS